MTDSKQLQASFHEAAPLGEQGSQIAGSALSTSAPRAGEAGLQDLFRNPALLKMPGDEWEFDDDTAVKWAWFAHGQHTGMTPYFSVAQLRAAFNAGSAPVEDSRERDAVDTLIEEGWTWDGDQWQRAAMAAASSGDTNG